MAVLPPSKVDKIQFCEEHEAPFSTNAVAIGTTTAAVTDLTTKTTAARAAFLAQQTAKQAAKDSTNTFDMAVTAMTGAAADIIKQIKAKAAIAGDGIYSLASIPVPATPAPVGPLGTPGDFKAKLAATGAVELSWKCTNPRGATGTMYQVWRRIGSGGAATAFDYLGGAGTKSFTDNTLPEGSSRVTYQLQAVRSTSVGPFAQFNVNFGVSSGGSMTASVEPMVMRKAA
jgi:hypothetical protein